MKITVISDTHTNSLSELPVALINDIKDSDIVVHAGDFGDKKCYSELQQISKKVYAVKGNNDLLIDLPKSIILELSGIKIAVVHGDGAIWMGMNDYLLKLFSNDNPDIIIYGHTHKPLIEQDENITLLNPGSSTLNRFVYYNSYAIISIDGNKFNIEIKKI